MDRIIGVLIACMRVANCSFKTARCLGKKSSATLDMASEDEECRSVPNPEEGTCFLKLPSRSVQISLSVSHQKLIIWDSNLACGKYIRRKTLGLG